MVFRNKDKEAIKKNSYTTLARIEIVGTDIVLTEDNYIVEFTYEDYRYVPNNGFIGQFVERILDGKLSQLPSNINLENADINLQIGIVNGLDGKTTFYDYGNFLVTNVTEEDTTGVINFESSDYTKKFNILYDDNIEYPCIALDLVNNICEQSGVRLKSDKEVYYYTPSNTLNSGEYSVLINDNIYEFKLQNNLNKLDTLMFFEDEEKVVIKNIDENYNITRIEESIHRVDNSDKKRLILRETKYYDFINNDFVISSNQYTENNSCREVIRDISKLAYTWARIDEHNELVFDFSKKEWYNIDEYDKLTVDEYYTSDKQPLVYGPVNKVLIGLSNIEGENVYISTDDCTSENECAIKIYDNLLTYTDELRHIAISSANVLFGLEYTPLNISSIGHPWLEGDELIQLTNVDNNVLYTYPFDRKIEYKGYLKTDLSSSAQTKTQTQYEHVSTITNKLRRTEIIVDKQEQSISGIIKDIGDRESRETTITEDIDGLSAEIKTVASPVAEDEGTGKRHVDDLMNNLLMYLQVHPTTTDIVSMYASPLIKANPNLKVISRNITFESDNDIFYYLLPTELYFLDDEIYDEFIQDNLEKQCYVIKRVGLDENGNKYKLQEEEYIKYENYKPIMVKDGSYNVYIDTYNSAFIKVKGLIKNDFTRQLATQVELNSKLELTDRKFEVGLSEKLDGKDFTGANIILQINNDESEAIISADKVDIHGFVTFSDLQEEGKTTINGSNINTGTLDASKVNVTNLNASNITGGTISADKISGGTINGNNVNVTNLNASNITGGTMSADKISGGTINGNNVNVTNINAGNITGGTMSADRISGGTIDGNNINVANLNASNITGGTLSANKINGGTINASAIKLHGVSLGTGSSSVGAWSIGSTYLYGTASGKGVQWGIFPYGVSNRTAGIDYYWGNIVTSSDARLKHDINNIEEKYEKFFDDLKPKTFYFNEYILDDKKHIGFIAQDILESEKLIDEDLSMVSKDSEYYDLDRREIVALNTWQIQKLKKQVKEQQEIIDKLIKKVGDLDDI